MNRIRIGLVFMSIIVLSASVCGEMSFLSVPIDSPPSQNNWSPNLHRIGEQKDALFVSSLPKGESNVGALRSEEFAAPATLSFWLCGHARNGRNVVKCVLADTGQVLKETPVPESDIAERYQWDLTEHAGKPVYIQLEDTTAGNAYAWLSFGGLEPELVEMPSSQDDPIAAGWRAIAIDAPLSWIEGVPYDRTGPWQPRQEGDGRTIDLPAIEAESLYLLGGGNSHDEANPAWGGGDSFKNLFLGDYGGSLKLTYQSGQVDEIPFVFGYSLWWRSPLLFANAPLSTDPQALNLLDDALRVVNGHEVWKEGNRDKPYYLKINLRPEPVIRIEIQDSENKIGYPQIGAMTFSGVIKSSIKQNQPFQVIESDEDVRPDIDRYAIESSDPYPEKKRGAVEAVSRLVTTFPRDVSAEMLQKTIPDITGENFPGPAVTFSGPPVAEILTRVYYENAHQILHRVDDETGMVHESGKGSDNYSLAFGLYAPGLQPFYDSAYTRIRSLTLLSNMGFGDKVNKALDFFDKWLLYFPESYPEVQLDGKPIPGHATVIANKPHLYYDTLRHHGWPTRYTSRDFGNPETDGHGMLMLSHWRAWLKQGRSSQWVNDRWRAIKEAAEFIPWSLNNPKLSFSEHGLLYSESEGGLSTISMYPNYLCYLGLLAYAEMAEATDHNEEAARWQRIAQDLKTAMEVYFTTTIEPWGDVWDPEKTAHWEYHHATLAPVVIGMDYYGFDVASALSKAWLERTKNTYRMQLTKNQPRYCAPAGMGYGQCYITQAGLLLDQMAEAGHMVGWMTKFCYAPTQNHPYRVPEGATIANDYSAWRRWGDLGNLYQMGEVVYTIHLILGIDDIDPSQLILMPRIPADWDGAEVSKWPVRIMSAGHSVLSTLDYELKRNGSTTVFTISLDDPLDAGRLRLGPFPPDAEIVEVRESDAVISFTEEISGDSKWAWVDLAGSQLEYRLRITQ